MAKQRIHVVCPCCQAGLTVDPESGLVLKSDQKKSEYSFEDALERHKSFKSTADDRFQKAFESEKQRTESLEKKFQEALASKDELEDPKRPFDWD
ncbi:MAG: hypothetical protein V3T83_08770 [Acidobacteriota bacterium]